MMVGSGRRVLVVDDEAMVRDLLTVELKGRKVEVVAVADGLQALREVHQQRFDAVITDLHVLYLDGFDLLRQCQLVWPDLPVILLSSHLQDVVRPAMALGAAACLPKPVDIGNLIHVLDEAIARLVPSADTTRMT
ncbi:MAG: response regulator [Nitrospira sp.]